MKKNKKLLVVLSGLASTLIPVSILSARCSNDSNSGSENGGENSGGNSGENGNSNQDDNGNSNEQTEEERIKEKTREINEAAQKLVIKFDKTKNTIEEALKIENYHFNLDAKYKFEKISLTKIDENSVSLVFRLKDEQNNIFSENVVKFFDFEFYSNSQWTEKSSVVNGITADKYGNLVHLYELDSQMDVRKAIEKLMAKKQKDNISVSNLTIESYDESTGTISIKFNYQIGEQTFTNKQATLSGFKKIEITNKDLLTISLNKNKLIEEKKDINQLNNANLMDYLTINFLNSNGESVDLIKLTKENPELYSFEYRVRFSDEQTKENVNFVLNINYKKKELNQKEQQVTAKVDVIRKQIKDREITKKEILDYIIDNKLTKKEVDNSSKFASSLLYLFRNTRKIVDNYVGNFEENYFSASEKIELANQNLTIDDYAGNAKISFNLKYNDNGKEINSKGKTISVNGFKKLTNEYLNNFDLIFHKTWENSSKSFINKVRQEYLKNPSQNFTLDSNWIKNNWSIGDSFVFLRMTQNQYNNTETLEYRKNPILQLNANGKSIEDCIREGSKIDIFNNGDDFEINNLNVTFESISIGNVNENRVEFSINTNLEVSIHSSQQQVIKIPKTVSWFFYTDKESSQ
ncbi:hypothetical protein [Mycoplasmopsis arginini]|uniref:hypothetical protein n=1 Tax=Mycoplasmopsis arginini TaxID=2094 RepID=UPI0027374F06|nr:hypothetical protein [Mycoplasmopsis arginini]MDP4042926.1 hypothetical protein [Mycoplasmopsis arginini]